MNRAPRTIASVSVWDSLVGQPGVVALLSAAAADAHDDVPGPGMTHAWLMTGPPGSGRSTAAAAFAAALLCPDRGCGHCQDCREVRAGSHPDVEVVRPEGISYRTADARALVARASIMPARGRWHVIVVEDADRLTETANNVLLRAIEEPPPRAVWILCSPSAGDVLPTIRSRCRHIALRTPGPSEVAEFLAASEGIDEAAALFAARAAQGHVGRARALANDGSARQRRQEILSVPSKLADLGACMQAAADLVATAKADALAMTAPLDEKERADLLLAWGAGAEGKGVKGGARGVKGALKELEDRQGSRRTRAQRDQLDRALVDLLAYYRDVLAVQFYAVSGGDAIDLINDELYADIERTARATDTTATMHRIDAIERARLALEANVSPLLALEALTIDLRNPSLRKLAT